MLDNTHRSRGIHTHKHTHSGYECRAHVRYSVWQVSPNTLSFFRAGTEWRRDTTTTFGFNCIEDTTVTPGHSHSVLWYFFYLPVFPHWPPWYCLVAALFHLTLLTPRRRESAGVGNDWFPFLSSSPFAASMAMFPFLTIQARSLGITEKELGIVYAFTPAITIIGPPLTGMIADKIGNFKVGHSCFCPLPYSFQHFFPPAQFFGVNEIFFIVEVFDVEVLSFLLKRYSRCLMD